MKKTTTLIILPCLFLIFFISHAFYPAPFPNSSYKQLLAKTNLFNLQFPQERIYLHLDRPSYWANDDIWFKAYLKNSPIPDCNLYVELLNSSGTVLLKRMYWAQNGLAYGDLHLADTISSGVYQIRAYTNWMRNFDDVWFFRQNLVIWNLRDKLPVNEMNKISHKDVDFQFFPEGGTFLAGISNKMAFKATDKNGKGIEVIGKVVDDLDNVVVELKSHFKGMGSFQIEPKEGRKYKAQITVAGGIRRNVDLPEAQAQGVAMSIDPTDTDKVFINIYDRSKETEPSLGKSYVLVGQSNGVISYSKEITMNREVFYFEIEKSHLPNGIVQFTLFDEEMIPRCERLVFNNRHEFITVQIAPDKPVYRTREKVQIDISTITDDEIPCFSNLSMSVYNPEMQLKLDDFPNSILSQFLLNSELKGTIEDPAYYFKDDSLSTILNLDNLMLTHGYRHFEWEAIKDNKYPEIQYQPEGSIQVKGTVTSSLQGKPVPDAQVTMMFVKSQFGLHDQTTDSLGRFLFSDLYFNDTVYVSLQAVNKKGRRTNWIELDRKSSISPKAGFLPLSYQYDNGSQVNTTAYLSEVSSAVINKKWRLSDTILLGDINVMTKMIKKGDGHVRMYVEPDYVFDLDKQDDVYGNIYEMMDGKIPGVRIDMIEKAFYIRGEIPAMLYLDAIPVDYEFLSTFSSQTFDKIEVKKTPPFEGIHFYTKRGEKFVNAPTDALGMKSSKIIGYSVIRKFYSPNYESQQPVEMKNDFRNTLYWNPIVRTDSTGVSKVNFYNSDQTGAVRVVVEGITSDGRLCRGVSQYNVID